MEDDVKHLKHSTPIVVFAHIPLWTIYPEWGWGTEDSEQMTVPAEQLKRVLGITNVNYVRVHHALAIVDSTLE